MIQYIILALLIILVLYFLRTNKINVVVNPEGNVAHLAAQMKSISKTYRPTPWLIGGHFHTVYGMRNRKRSSYTNKCSRELFVFADEGTAALDTFETSDMPSDAPLVLLNPTLGGGTREPIINNLAEALMKKGFRVVVGNARGCAGAPITSPRLSCGADYDDLQAIISHLKEKHQPKFVFIAGFSLGALQSMCFSAFDGSVDGICCVSHLYNTLEGSFILDKFPQSKLYTPIMLKQLRHTLTKSKFIENPEAMKAKTLHEFDDVFTAKTRGFKSYREYYKATEIYDKIPKAKTPTLVIGADDDPFTNKKYLPINEVQKSDNVILVHTAEGGHVSFVTGINGRNSLIDQIIPEFFLTIISDKQK
ncbi:Clan SC, family S33, methylesterase-like serine peptidase [Tritrichomonas foetus]|uniref:Clan SC, family S33, methylesterase-like serine peptidase n=1 Tax=Tritrichomonas foetus TaxID=1144522 RepID=A0A1J4JW33_9EUKA|nr:Clan SC, family S33, methylesterase-like serine peptidase [Tritrichomonas foetus]|eukprot:OHT01732.1 Clan SC, family S33, methylesterase-like serine peptidase [Tritrichomonas foetus]